MMSGRIDIRGARQHNLKNLSLSLPRDQLVVITGPSGSGKSSLAFDTIYAEAQRRYVESLSVYARQFLGQLPKPDMDGIDGLSPAICVRQQGIRRNPRSTVGTLTEIYDYLRLLYARVGVARSPHTGKEMHAVTAEQAVDRVLTLPAETKVVISAPLVRDQAGAFEELFARLRRDGFVRVEVDGVVRDLGEEIRLDARISHSIAVQVDRVRSKPSQRQRISEAVELAYRLSGGLVRVASPDGLDWMLSEQLRCADTGQVYGTLTPRTFSFNSPEGACGECAGLGRVHQFEDELVAPDPTLSLNEGAIAAWGSPDGRFYQRELSALTRALEVDLDRPWGKLSKGLRHKILHGTAGAAGKAGRAKKPTPDALSWEGVLPALTRRVQAWRRQRASPQDESESVREALGYLEDHLSRFAREAACPACEGTRLSPLARHVVLQGASLPELAAMPLGRLLGFFEGLVLSGAAAEVAAPIVRDVVSRLRAVVDLGLSYLALDRSMVTLSGGEVERIRLATQIGLGLVGVLYVLDEPSAGLHARDNERLIRSLTRLRDQGNTLVVVEHDLATIRAADHVVDLGPAAGDAGGFLMAQGRPAQIADHPDSPTGRYLRGATSVAPPVRRRLERWVTLGEVSLHNLKAVRVGLPVGALTCVTGVSGSGKSSLIVQSLLPAARAAARGKPQDAPVPLVGGEVFDRVIEVDQGAIGRSPRSSPASYLGALDEIRDLFASLPEARARGFGPARFSFNVKGGRCEVCKGDGLVRVDMEFLPDTYVRCEACQGRRYNRETLEVRYRGLDISEVLSLSAGAAQSLFSSMPKLFQRLSALCDVGLGYLRIGQSASTLSGGEAQRVKLAKELARRTTGRTLLVLDEPTAGLHMDDVGVLIGLLHRLVDAGNTVVVIEHHLELAKAADFVVDLGPEGGPHGGEIVCVGRPEEVAAVPGSHTGRYLRDVLGDSSSARCAASRI